MSFEEIPVVSDWREHAGPLGVEPPTRAELEKKKAAEAVKKKAADLAEWKEKTGNQFTDDNLKIISEVND